MAPLSKAITIESSSFSGDDTSSHTGRIDPEWNVASIPNGGYVLALVVEACIKHQARTPLRDPIHVTAHFLRTTAVSVFEIHVHTLRTGKNFTNVAADFKQQNETKLTVHVIFGVLSSMDSASDPRPTLAPPSPYARRIPLLTHPSELKATHWTRRPLGYASRIGVAEDPAIRQRNKEPTSCNYDAKELEWGAWFELAGAEEKITTPSIAFLADTFTSLPVLLAQQEPTGPYRTGNEWFPTLTLSIEFKFPIPTSQEYARRTVGVHARGRYINNPQGRHETVVEVWSAPTNIGEDYGQIPQDWREKQRCLAVSSQMALIVPMALNLRKAERAATGSKL
ncbi:hypothetical protein GLOTRDRAFT_139013 [Gloeophyllum trabeum ATCC 11539]|uniref:Thioesterase/thiol ester dehydrase-isomerase n=1 Tax=Gloeophyllum trabeum (strain ATCC 11539 / FP-39264 / Madison 617) TaxID=670483 RepID=S7RNR7_GLOTA|nr:uncharacterized protein GLOTRDRAFT_139013 [Gloeophyllum trabeum ATCC 11539]EPQ54419.1 hypothetical protein GLOTRDRAFT_139013 [Gloeophyllum trabeum ATCC 11539]